MIIVTPPPEVPTYEAEHTCLACSAVLLVSESDLYKTAGGLGGNLWVYFDCCCCETRNPAPDAMPAIARIALLEE